MFITQEYNPRGLYKVKIFDPIKKKFVVVTVDDRIPCKKKTKKPRFMSPNGNELWAIILEKAYAKWCGSYAALDGGVSIIESIVFHLGIYELNSLRFHILRYLSSFPPLFSSSCGAGIA
jgi:hypothetical protein